jgi:hypothetical protein
MVAAYSLAAHHRSAQWPNALSALALLAVMLPAGVRLAGRGASTAERLSLVVAVGLFSFLPKFLRDPTAPVFFDELGHWRQVQALGSAHTLFLPSQMIPIVQFFPGLHALVVALGALAGQFTWPMAELLLVVLHVTALLGVWTIASRVWRSHRIAGVAALAYAANPGFTFFDAQFAYESFGVVLAIWTVAAAVNLQAAEDRRARGAWFAIGLLLGGACTATHHISSVVSVAILLSMSISSWICARRRPEHRAAARLTTALTVTVAAVIALWWVLIAAGTIRYLSPTFSGGMQQLVRLIDHENQGRQAFAHSTAPLYERVAGLLAPLVIGVLALRGLSQLRGRRPEIPGGGGALMFGSLYFASLPFILSVSGSEAAHRSWTFSWIGLSLLISLPIVGRPTDASTPGGSSSRLARVALVAAAATVIVGNLAVGIDQQYRFPGPYVVGADARALTSEAVSAAGWLSRTQGHGHLVATDRSTSLAFYATGDERVAVPYSGLPLWELYASESAPSPQLLARLAAADVQYLVVDRRLASALPRIGFYFDPSEPDAYRRTRPLSLAALTKFDALPWATAIYRSDHITIYRLSLASSPTTRTVSDQGGGR